MFAPPQKIAPIKHAREAFFLGFFRKKSIFSSPLSFTVFKRGVTFFVSPQKLIKCAHKKFKHQKAPNAVSGVYPSKKLQFVREDSSKRDVFSVRLHF